MELIVIFLIGLELIAAIRGIVIAVREGTEQARILERQASVLERVENSASKTATVLERVQALIQSQNEQASRVLLDATYSGDVLYVTNTGQPTIFIDAVRAGAVPIPPVEPPRALSTGGRAQLSVPIERTIATGLVTRQQYRLPLELDLEDSGGNQYVATTQLIGRRNSGKGAGISMVMEKLTVSKRNWRK